MTKAEFWRIERDNQRKWIDEHGGCLAGYIQRYGDPGMEHCYGSGGTAIYEADLARLRECEAICKHLRVN